MCSIQKLTSPEGVRHMQSFQIPSGMAGPYPPTKINSDPTTKADLGIKQEKGRRGTWEAFTWPPRTGGCPSGRARHLPTSWLCSVLAPRLCQGRRSRSQGWGAGRGWRRACRPAGERDWHQLAGWDQATRYEIKKLSQDKFGGLLQLFIQSIIQKKTVLPPPPLVFPCGTVSQERKPKFRTASPPLASPSAN